jgi:beta-lactamase class A
MKISINFLNRVNKTEQPGQKAAAQKRKKRRRRLPPGQRLILYTVLSSLVILSTTIFTHPSSSQGSDISSNLVPQKAPFQLQTEISGLADQLKTICDKPKLRAGVFVVDPTTGEYIDIHGQEQFSAASMIKVPVLVELMRAIDNNEVDKNAILTMRKDLVAGGSGILQWRPVNSKISLKETAELMIIVSDNTATNMIIDLLGGKDRFNKSFKTWGLQQTSINDWLPDYAGTNKTSPFDLSYLMARVDQGELISTDSRTWMMNIMHRTKTRTLLPRGLGKGATIAHKTGDIGSMVGDTGLVKTPQGKKYLISVQVERPHNDLRANELARQISRLVYTAITGEQPCEAVPVIRTTPAPKRAYSKSNKYRSGRRHV